MTPTFATSVAHLPTAPGRAESMGKLALRLQDGRYVVEGRPGKNWEWSWRQWERGYRLADRLGASHCLFLNDDIRLLDFFWPNLERAVSKRPNDILCLHSNHWLMKDAYMGGADWAETYDGLVGTAYVIPRFLMPEMFQFMKRDLRPEAKAQYPEDSRLNLWCMATGRSIFHPLPSLIDHDTSLESCYGNDEHLYRSPVVKIEGQWSYSGRSQLIGLVYEREHFRLRSHLTDAAVRKYQAIELMYELEKYRNPRIRPQNSE